MREWRWWRKRHQAHRVPAVGQCSLGAHPDNRTRRFDTGVRRGATIHDDGADGERAQLESVTTSLNRVADAAPGDEAVAAANVVAQHRRALSFAQEAGDLLRSGQVPPTAEQLVQADQSSRLQLTQLDEAIHNQRTQVSPASAEPSAG